jgi:hypothetical protein
VNNGRSFRPIYDRNFPKKIVAIKSVRDGKEIAVPAGFSGQAPNIALERLKRSGRSLKPCSMVIAQASTNSVKIPATSQSLIAEDGWEYGEDWAGAGFASEFINVGYWIDEDRPYFEEAVQFAEKQSAQRSCIDRANACSDACDNASDARNVSCAIGVLVYSEIPVGAGLFGIACALASNKQKYECKDRCPSISSCF